jgi:hypothetical protein
MSARLRVLLALACALAAATLTLGLVAAVGWPLWQDEGVGVCVADGAQENPQLIPDGQGGAVVVWQDERNSVTADIYGQRVDGDGNPLWTAGGVSVCLANSWQNTPQLIPDGSGGSIITWKDLRTAYSYDIYAQRLDSYGNAQWQDDGVSLCVTIDWNQHKPQLVSDGMEGAIVAWEDQRGYTTPTVEYKYDIYAQRVYSDGTAVWGTNGVSLCAALDNQYMPQIATDGVGGAIVAWQDYRLSTTMEYDIYAQRVYSDGTTAWATDGVSLCVEPEDQEDPQLIPDGASGAIVVWSDDRVDMGIDIYAQRILSDGTRLWDTSGEGVCHEAGDQSGPQIAPDGLGGAFVTWKDERVSADGGDIYAQRVDANGNMHWTDGGVPVCVQPGEQGDPQIASDGSGGALVTWFDKRNGGDYNIYAQRIDSSGQGLWQKNGVLLCEAALNQRLPQIVSDEAGGAIVTWYDYRNPSTHYDIYVQRVGDLPARLSMPLLLKRH